MVEPLHQKKISVNRAHLVNLPPISPLFYDLMVIISALSKNIILLITDEKR
jgi:hypothetical protein